MFASWHACVFGVTVVYQWASQIRCSEVCPSVDIVWDSGHILPWTGLYGQKAHTRVKLACCLAVQPQCPSRLLGLVYHVEEARPGSDWRRWTCHSSGLASVPLSFSSHAERKTTADPVLFQRRVCARNPMRKSECTRERESVLVGAYEERQGEGEYAGCVVTH